MIVDWICYIFGMEEVLINYMLQNSCQNNYDLLIKIISYTGHSLP